MTLAFHVSCTSVQSQIWLIFWIYWSTMFTQSPPYCNLCLYLYKWSNWQGNKVIINTALCSWTTENLWLQQSTERKNYLTCWDSVEKSLLPLAQWREKSLWDCVTLSYMCNSENQLSELCLLPWSPDKNTQGESESMSALPPAPCFKQIPFIPFLVSSSFT